MRATEKVQNVLRGLVQRYGTAKIKRWLWNYEYRRGCWNHLDKMAEDYVYPHIEKYARKGSILDLGCGPGAVGNELNASTYHLYTGVDISDVAVEKATSRTLENCRVDKNEYFQSDIFSYVPKQQYDVIFFGDSIHYFEQQRIGEMLDRYSKYLKPDGVFVLRTWILKDEHLAMVHHIESHFDVLEKRRIEEPPLAILVFQPPANRRATLTLRDHS